MKMFFKLKKDKQEGSAMLITTIIITALLVIVATTVNMAGRQMDLAALNRNTSNTYHLAKSAAEKQVDMMNKTMEEQLIYIINEMNTSNDDTKNYITQLINKGSNIEYVEPVIDSGNIVQKKGLIKVDNNVIKEHLYTSLRDALNAEYVTGESLLYTAQGDRENGSNETDIKIDVTDVTTGDVPSFKIVATATTMNGTSKYDEQVVEAMVEVKLPNEIINEIDEEYEYTKEDDGSDIVPDILKGAVTCYSDLIVNTGTSLMVEGDIYVGGKPNIDNYGTTDSPLYPEPDQNGGIIAINGGNLEVQGSVYTTRNIMATSGWGTTRAPQSKITIGKDAVAYTVGIVDDFYKDSENQNPFHSGNQVTRNNITVGGNLMVDNDVMIDRWVNESSIDVTGSIYGINSGSDSASAGGDIDPNQSSGIFSQGPGSKITAHQMFVAGQPYITLAEGQKPLKLWESIGEPFDGVASYKGYATGNDNIGNADYLLPDSPFHSMIATDKINTTFDKTYATAKVSGIDIGDADTPKVGAECSNILMDQSQATQFFSQGGSSVDFANTVDGTVNTNADADYIAEVQNIIDNIGNCYVGQEIGTVKKIEGTAPTHNYKGIRGYMTVNRSVLYKEFEDGGIVPLTFEEATQGMLPGGSNPNPIFAKKAVWSYSTPIIVTDPSAATSTNISAYYIKDENRNRPHPSIIINTSKQPLTITSKGANKEFHGVIISNGPVHINKDITIKGNIIVGGQDAKLVPGTVDRKEIFEGANKGLTVGPNVKIIGDSSMIFKVESKNKDLYRAVLDMLGITHYDEYTTKANDQMKNILDMQEHHMYGRDVLNYTKESVLELNTEGMEVTITGLKKAQ